jgi:hypothetical protein
MSLCVLNTFTLNFPSLLLLRKEGTSFKRLGVEEGCASILDGDIVFLGNFVLSPTCCMELVVLWNAASYKNNYPALCDYSQEISNVSGVQIISQQFLEQQVEFICSLTFFLDKFKLVYFDISLMPLQKLNISHT